MASKQKEHQLPTLKRKSTDLYHIQHRELTIDTKCTLHAGPTVTILFKNNTDTDGDVVRVVYEDFPKNVATAFFTKWEAELSPTKGAVGNIKNSTRQTIVVSGADGDTWRKILDWMIRCCQGFGYAQVQIKS
ncbi:uncharacterized protein Z519_12329 [Cladophialophora bantiana CBS 173.52]|uniref:Uncharacterized protein n=1 Tax=Cladophialophora bantiana (strain ATCC 10958 / CBS 173.52 / CDC B-1940 / NIH 8579) TaxID=1442370 RepID=A0A0D2FK24_CLAB1|nr:uncharacterized protein Z519_12329 [Cladophialophora bantiana CBS 173.52]KIW87032.1 hypothetical protein Z519_12329 [Cladophialophora bantiana CBS 173.52]